MNVHRNTQFRWILPVAQLVVCTALLWPWRGFLAEQLRATVQDHWPMRANRPAIYIDLTEAPPKTPQQRHNKELLELRTTVPQLLNLPCAMLGLLRRDAVPRGMLPEFWRSISWPLFGIIFWWIAGRGIDALLASRRDVLSPAITWMEVFVALLMIASGVFVWGLFFSGDHSGFVFPWSVSIPASTLWILLGGTTISARAVQWRIRRRSAT